MAKSDYVPLDDNGKDTLFTHVATTLPQHFVALNITAASPGGAGQAQDAAAFHYLCTSQQTLIGAAQQATNAKNRLRDGDLAEPNVAVGLDFPVAPAIVPTSVLPGVVFRFRSFVKWIKALPLYVESIGESLQIVGDEETATDLSTVQPVLPLKISGGRVEVGWKWDGLTGQVDALEIWVDRGNGTWVLLTIDTRPGYVDTEPFPITSAKWKYKAIWRKDDARVGIWSNVSEITVG